MFYNAIDTTITPVLSLSLHLWYDFLVTFHT